MLEVERIRSSRLSQKGTAREAARPGYGPARPARPFSQNLFPIGFSRNGRVMTEKRESDCGAKVLTSGVAYVAAYATALCRDLLADEPRPFSHWHQRERDKLVAQAGVGIDHRMVSGSELFTSLSIRDDLHHQVKSALMRAT